MQKVKLGLIGCGRVAGHHANMMRGIEEVQLVSVCDLNEARAKELAKEHSVPYYLNYHQMVRSEDLDVISIITPSGMHPYHAIDVMSRYKKHVVIEKPMVLNIEDASKLAEVAEKNNVKVFPIYQNRYNKAVQKVKGSIENGELGKIVMASVRLHWCRPQHYYNRDPWRGTWAMDGGALTNQGIHYVDLLQWLVGDVSVVNSQKATQLVNVAVEDTMIGWVRFTGGALGTVEITTAARPKDFEASVTILGEKGSAIIAGIATNVLTEFTPAPEECKKMSEDFSTVYGFGHGRLLKAVALDLLGKSQYPISFDEAMKSIRILNAFYVSSETGKTVFVSDNPSSSLLGQPDQKLIDLYTTQL